MNAGYDTTVPFPEYIRKQRKRELAKEMIDAIKSSKNCSASGLAEAIECSFVAPKCNALGEPIYPCKQVCAEFLKQCEFDLDEFSLDYLVSACLVLSNGSSSCAPCFTPPNFKATYENVTGPLDRGCVELIIPACKNLGLYDYTLTSIPVQEELYHWFYGKEYPHENPETEFPDFALELFERYPKCQENIKKLFCGEHLPPCFPEEGPRLYSLCQPLCDAIATDCPEFFSHDLPAAEYCGTMAKGKSKHGFCQSTVWPELFNWVRYAEATKATPKVSTSSTMDPKTKGTKVWAITVTVLLTILMVGLFVWGIFWWKLRSKHTPAYSKQYIKQRDDVDPLETET